MLMLLYKQQGKKKKKKDEFLSTGILVLEVRVITKSKKCINVFVSNQLL